MAQGKRHSNRRIYSTDAPQGDRHVSVQGNFYQGPLPVPKDLQAYNDAYPKAAEIIIQNFQKESDHRRKMDAATLNLNYRLARIGQWGYTLGSILPTILGFAAMFVLLLFEKPQWWIGGLFATPSILFQIFVQIKSSSRSGEKNSNNSRTRIDKEA